MYQMCYHEPEKKEGKVLCYIGDDTHKRLIRVYNVRIDSAQKEGWQPHSPRNITSKVL